MLFHQIWCRLWKGVLQLGFCLCNVNKFLSSNVMLEVGGFIKIKLFMRALFDCLYGLQCLLPQIVTGPLSQTYLLVWSIQEWPYKIFGRKSIKNLMRKTNIITLRFFTGCPPQILLGAFFNNFSHLIFSNK